MMVRHSEKLYFVSLFYKEFEANLIEFLLLSKIEREKENKAILDYTNKIAKKIEGKNMNLNLNLWKSFIHYLSLLSATYISKKFPEFEIKNLSYFLDNFYLVQVKKARELLSKEIEEIFSKVYFQNFPIYESLKEAIREENKNYLKLNDLYGLTTH
jgi:uncharacterized protein YhbP (UPF0306 family)